MPMNVTQKLFERTGRRSATRYDADFDEQLRLVDATKTLTSRYADRLTAVMAVYDARSTGGKHSANRMDALGTCMSTYVAELTKPAAGESASAEGKSMVDAAQMDYAKQLVGSLQAGSELAAYIADAQHSFAKHVYAKMVTPMHDYVSVELRTLFEGRERLRRLRVDMDAAAHRAASAAASTGDGDNMPPVYSDKDEPVDISEAGISERGSASGGSRRKKRSFKQGGSLGASASSWYRRAKAAHDAQYYAVSEMLRQMALVHGQQRDMGIELITMHRQHARMAADAIDKAFPGL